MQADRRRINPPTGGTAPPTYALPSPATLAQTRPTRTRASTEHRKIFLRTGVVPSASGSAYYEIPPAPKNTTEDALYTSKTSSLKISCTVHGPRPLPRNASYSPNLLLSTHVKFAPFASRVRRGYVRDGGERDLGVHLEGALRGVVIGERWPKSAAEIVVTILEGEEDAWVGAGDAGRGGGWGTMSVLAGCISAASAALVDAGIDCVDLVSGGVAAVVGNGKGSSGPSEVVLDPTPAEHEMKAACVVGYLQSRDEVTEVWMKGDVGKETGTLIHQAVKAASMTRVVLAEAVKEAAELKMAKIAAEEELTLENGKKRKDVTMTG